MKWIKGGSIKGWYFDRFWSSSVNTVTDSVTELRIPPRGNVMYALCTINVLAVLVLMACSVSCPVKGGTVYRINAPTNCSMCQSVVCWRHDDDDDGDGDDTVPLTVPLTVPPPQTLPTERALATFPVVGLVEQPYTDTATRKDKGRVNM